MYKNISQSCYYQQHREIPRKRRGMWKCIKLRKDNMKEKIEEILRTHSVVSNIQGVRFVGLCNHVGAYKDVKKPYDREVGALIKEISTLIQEERKEAVEGFITDFIETGVYEGVGSIEDIMKLWRKYNAHN